MSYNYINFDYSLLNVQLPTQTTNIDNSNLAFHNNLNNSAYSLSISNLTADQYLYRTNDPNLYFTNDFLNSDLNIGYGLVDNGTTVSEASPESQFCTSGTEPFDSTPYNPNLNVSFLRHEVVPRQKTSEKYKAILEEEYFLDKKSDRLRCKRIQLKVPGMSPRQIQVWFQNRRARDIKMGYRSNND